MKHDLAMTTVDPVALAREIADMRADIQRMARMLERATVTPAPEWITAKDAAAHFGVTTKTLREWRRAGRIEAKGAGKALRYRVER